MSELPEGWTTCKVDQIFESFSGGTPSKNEAGYWTGKIPWISSGEFSSNIINEGTEFISKDGLENSSAKLCRPGSIIVVVRSGILKHTLPVAIVGKKLAINQDIKCFDSGDDELNRWLFFSLKKSARDILRLNREGTTVQSVKYDTLKEHELILPPLNEQRRIVTKLEKLLSRVDAAQERLATIPRILKRFRQSVLAAACSGRLTADWREENPNIDVASQLVERTNKQRRSRILVEILEAEESLEDLPSTWLWVRFGTVIGELRNGVSIRPSIEPPGTPMLRISATRPGRVDLDEVRYLPNGNDFLPSYSLRDRDLLFTRYNGSLELLGVCGMVRGLGENVLLYPDKLMRVRFDHDFISPQYAEIFFQAPDVHNRVIAKSKSSAGQNGVSGSDIKAQAFALPPLKEQQEIVRRVEALFKTADALEGRYLKAKAHVDKLTQSILAKAFRGELVPQEPNDEPAPVLLSRIQLMAQANKTKKRFQKGGSHV